jgi:hypothetical protein
MTSAIFKIDVMWTCWIVLLLVNSRMQLKAQAVSHVLGLFALQHRLIVLQVANARMCRQCRPSCRVLILPEGIGSIMFQEISSIAKMIVKLHLEF